MNTLFLCCCRCQLISELLNLICNITWPICIAIIIAAIAKSPILHQWVRSSYEYRFKKRELKSKQNGNSSNAFM